MPAAACPGRPSPAAGQQHQGREQPVHQRRHRTAGVLWCMLWEAPQHTLDLYGNWKAPQHRLGLTCSAPELSCVRSQSMQLFKHCYLAPLCPQAAPKDVFASLGSGRAAAHAALGSAPPQHAQYAAPAASSAQRAQHGLGAGPQPQLGLNQEGPGLQGDTPAADSAQLVAGRLPWPQQEQEHHCVVKLEQFGSELQLLGSQDHQLGLQQLGSGLMPSNSQEQLGLQQFGLELQQSSSELQQSSSGLQPNISMHLMPSLTTLPQLSLPHILSTASPQHSTRSTLQSTHSMPPAPHSRHSMLPVENSLHSAPRAPSPQRHFRVPQGTKQGAHDSVFSFGPMPPQPRYPHAPHVPHAHPTALVQPPHQPQQQQAPRYSHALHAQLTMQVQQPHQPQMQARQPQQQQQLLPPLPPTHASLPAQPPLPSPHYPPTTLPPLQPHVNGPTGHTMGCVTTALSHFPIAATVKAAARTSPSSLTLGAHAPHAPDARVDHTLRASLPTLPGLDSMEPAVSAVVWAVCECGLWG